MSRSSHPSPDQRITQAREHLTHARRHRVTELPPSALIRELAESRRQLGQLLDVIADFEAADTPVRSGPIDSESWTCRACGGVFIGGKPATLTCGQCTALFSGPYETEAEVRQLPAVRAVYEAFDADPGVGRMTPHNLDMLIRACWGAGVEVGAYDRRILAWLAGFEPQTCAVIAGLITRAAGGAS